MSDQERDLPSKDEARVQRLLAEARVDSPTPPEVVRRLDGVLAGLEGVPGEGDKPVVDQLTRRRRRNVSRLLLAAAAVIVAGIGINAVVSESGPDAASTTALDTEAEGGDAGSRAVPDRTTATAPLGGDLDAPAEPAPEATTEQGTQLTTESAPYAIALGSGGLNQAVQRVMAVARGATVSDSGYLDLAEADLGPGLSFTGDFVCTPAFWGPGRLVPVYYAGTPNVLALRAPIGNTQVVEVLQCGTGEVVRSLSLPAGR